MAIYALITMAAALLLSVGDPLYDINNDGLQIVKISLMDTFFGIGIFLVFLYFKPEIRSTTQDYINRTLNLIITVSIIYNVISISRAISLNSSSFTADLFPFGILIENIARIAPFLAAYYWKDLTSFNRMLTFIALIAFYGSIISGGSRGLLILSVFFLLFWCYRGGILKSIILVIFLAAVYSQVEDVHRSFRAVSWGGVDGQNLFEKLSNVSLEDIGATDIGFVETFRTRITHIHTLMRPVDDYILNNDPAGLSPLVSSIQSIVPSALYQGDKPWPGSVDGTKFTSFGYLVNDIAHGAGWNMSEYPSVLHPIWELGYVYVFITIFVSGFAMASILRISRYIGDKLLILPVVSIYPFTYSRFLPNIAELPLIINYIFIPGIIAVVVLRSLSWLRNLIVFNMKLTS